MIINDPYNIAIIKSISISLSIVSPGGGGGGAGGGTICIKAIFFSYIFLFLNT
jgi:hypothetical protein